MALVVLLGGARLAVEPPWREASAAVATGETAIVAADRLNVRSGPGLDFPIVAVLEQGQPVTLAGDTVAADGYDWAPIAAPAGWVAGAYLATAGAPAAFSPGDRVLVDAGALNLRAAPGTDAPVRRVLPAVTLLTITDGPTDASGFTWYAARTTEATGGDTGWVIGAALVRAPAEMPDPAVAFDIGGTVHVATDLLRLRGGPGTSAAVRAELAGGTTLTVTGGPVGAEGYTWYPVQTAAGARGWVAERYLASGPGSDNAPMAAIGPGAPALVDVASLNLRAAPGLGAAVKGQLTAGTWLMVVAGPMEVDGYHWYQVDTANGVTGFVIGEALVPIR
jgi:N-acetylmuramoyl-L-alanine amidase